MSEVNAGRDKLAIGVDIGGTKVAVGLVQADGTIVRQLRAPMQANGEAAAGLTAVTTAIDAVLTAQDFPRSKICGIGVCSPGPLDPESGVVINPPNLPCWRNFPLAQEIARHLDLPVQVDNDGNAAALAEAIWGTGRGYRIVFYSCIGTGIGTGIVFDEKIYHGRTGAAGEGGHVSIDYRGPRCGCGKPGCIEALASGPVIARRARERLASDSAAASTLLALAEGSPDRITSEMVGQAYAGGDMVAAALLQETADLLTFWLGNMVDLLDPGVIVLGGGVAAMLEPFFDRIRHRLPGCCVNPRSREVPILMARYGADSGIAGGAALCLRRSKVDHQPGLG
jgi:glucokinase